MKKINIIILTTLFSNLIIAQKPKIEIFESNLKENIINEHVYKPYYNNSFVYKIVTGNTAFTLKNDLLLIDTKTLEEKAIIPYPEVEKSEYLDLDLNLTDNMVKDNFILYSKKVDPVTKKINIYVNKISETFVDSKKTVFLFSISKDDYQNSRTGYHLSWYDNQKSQDFNLLYPDQSINHYMNEKRDLILYSYQAETKKNMNQKNYYYLFDNNFKLLKTDSLVIKANTDIEVYDIMLNDGFVNFSNENLTTNVKIYNVLKNNYSEFSITSQKPNIKITSLKKIGEKYYLCGTYFEKVDKRSKNNGIFKIVYNEQSKTIEEEIYFKNEPKGKYLREDVAKSSYFSYITEDGTCFIGICQRYVDLITYQEGKRVENRYEVMCINKNVLWQKTLAIGLGNLKECYYLNNTIFIKCYANKGFNHNNYIYGEKITSRNGEVELRNDAYLSILKINSEGDIKYRVISDDANQSESSWYSEKLYTGTIKSKAIDFKKITLTE